MASDTTLNPDSLPGGSARHGKVPTRTGAVKGGVSGPAVAAAGACSGSSAARDISDELLGLVRNIGHLRARMTASMEPEVGALFLVGKLLKNGPTIAKELSEAIWADQSTVSRQVAVLVKAGLIERRADPDDGRASILVPTPLGVARFEKHFVNRGRALEPVIADWPDTDRQEFLRLLRRFNHSFDQEEVAKAIEHARSLLDSDQLDRSQSQPQASIERFN